MRSEALISRPAETYIARGRQVIGYHEYSHHIASLELMKPPSERSLSAVNMLMDRNVRHRR